MPKEETTRKVYVWDKNIGKVVEKQVKEKNDEIFELKDGEVVTVTDPNDR
jgi:ribosome recycling factor